MAIVVQSTMLVPQATATSIDVPVQTLSASDQTTPVLATIFRRQRSTGHTTDELTDPPGYRTFREENCDSDLQYSARPAQPASYPITTLKWQPCDSAHPIVFYFKPAQTAAVRVGVWPGAYGQAAVAAMVEPFAAEHPLISATVIELAGSAEVVARLAADPGFVDVANVDARTARTLCDEGLALPIDHDVMLAPGSDGLAGSDFFPGSIQSECFVPQVAYSTVIAYNRATLQSAAPPDKVADFFDIETYPGRRVAPNNPRALLEWALYANGVPPDEIYDTLASDEGMEMAFGELSRIRESLTFAPSFEAMRALVLGEATFAAGFHVDAFRTSMASDGQLQIIWDGQVVQWAGSVALADSADLDAALTYLFSSTSPQPLADLARLTAEGPARRGAATEVGPYDGNVDLTPFLPTHPENYGSPIVLDVDFYLKNEDRLRERFDAWLAQ